MPFFNTTFIQSLFLYARGLSLSVFHNVDIGNGVDGTDGAPGSWFVHVGEGKSYDGGRHHHGEHSEGQMSDPHRNAREGNQLRKA